MVSESEINSAEGAMVKFACSDRKKVTYRQLAKVALQDAEKTRESGKIVNRDMVALSA